MLTFQKRTVSLTQDLKNMKKHLPTVAGILLGLLFLMASLAVLLKLAPVPKFPEGTPIALFMGAFAPTGYMTFVKIFELTGAILVMIPRTRNFGLLVLGPIIVNILAFHTFILHGEGLLDPMLIAIIILALYLLWDARQKFLGLLK